MRIVSAKKKELSGARLLQLALGLMVVLVACPMSLAQAAQINSTIRVCVTDEDDPPTKVKDKVFITLFNTAAKIGRAGADGCFTTAAAQFDSKRTYFAVAVKEDKLGFSGFTFTDEDNNQLHTIAIKLTKSSKVPERSPSVTICAEDEGKNRVAVKDIVLAGDNGQLEKTPSGDSGCIRIHPTADNDYQLNLVTAVAQVAPGVVGIPRLQLALMIAILLSIFGVGAALRKVIKRQSKDLRLLDPLNESVRSISTDVADLKEKVTSQEKATPQAPTTPDAVLQDESKGSEDETSSTKPEDPPEPSEINQDESPQTEDISPLTAEDLSGRSVAQAQQKYADFIARRGSDFFFLMPIGGSEASDLVAEAKAKLREQSGGKYIAFCLGENKSEAWVFPKPNLHFTPETFSAVFPKLEETEYQSGNIVPKKAISIEPQLWRIE